VNDREHLWLPLLCALTDEVPSWLVWKNVDSALHRTGDIDSAAHPESWGVVTDVFGAWAEANALGPSIVCDHIPGGRNLVTCRTGDETLLELSVKNTKSWRGSTLFTLADLQRLAETDVRGFRRLRPGAEGVFKLLLNGTRWLGRRNEQGIAAKDVQRLLGADPQGVALTAALFGDRARDVRALADAVVLGGWDRRAAARVERAALAHAAMSPAPALNRLRFRAVTARSCPVLRALLDDGRRVPADVDHWLDVVRRTHVVDGRPPVPAAGAVR
jgi:hypothetical protein